MKRPSPRSKPRAIERNSARRANWVRLTRTILLGTLATAAAIVWLGEQYGIEREVIFELMGVSALFVGGLVVAGLCGMLLLRGLKKLLGRGSR